MDEILGFMRSRIVLLTMKKRAWENLPKRIYLANILYTLVYYILATCSSSKLPPTSHYTNHI